MSVGATGSSDVGTDVPGNARGRGAQGAVSQVGLSGAGTVARRYAIALYDLAAERRELDRTVEEAEGLGRLIDESPELARVLASPVIRPEEGRRAVTASLEQQGFSLLIRNFVGVVAANRRLAVLRTILASFASLAAERRGVVAAEVTTAHALTDAQRGQLQMRLAAAGYGSVRIAEHVDPSLLGGLTLRVGARLYDASIKSRLQRLAYRMKGAA